MWRGCRSSGPTRAYQDVQRLTGIGPFYARLIVLRASGFADALAGLPEPKGAAFATHDYGRVSRSAAEAFADLAERWRPFRAGRQSITASPGPARSTIQA